MNKYQKNSYDYEGRFCSYWHQINEIRKTVNNGENILEIGPGNNFLKDYLSKRTIGVETLDITSETNPTYIGNVTQIPCDDKQFDCVCAFQVLEHQPFDKFAQSIIEMSRVSKKYLIFSVPDVRWFFSTDIRLFSSSKSIRFLLSSPRLINRRLLPAKNNEEHHWEIGRPNFSVKKIIDELALIEGINLERHYRIISNPIHHIFVYSKKIPS